MTLDKKRRTRQKISTRTERLIGQALEEDRQTGDVTSLATITAEQKGSGRVFAKEAGVLAGLEVARLVLKMVDPTAQMTAKATDGDTLEKGDDIARVKGPLRSLLTAERLMLNFLQRLSGVATLTRQYVDALGENSRTRILDTRKTTPLWRELERHAVVMGGGENHRFALHDMYLIKNNHIDAAGGVRKALERVHQHNKKRRLPVAVEARTLDEVREVVASGADIILLDNMRIDQIRRAIDIIEGRCQIEVSGGITPCRVKSLSRLDVDRISVGALTHSAPALDISLHLIGDSLS
ncbi:MAG: carboxylating nicotinate-nucleotide diphosphorylase [Candidatus Sumerlaeota bacterium]